MAILGIDEVGRGPLAGPLVVGAVILPEDKPEWVEELRDSKKLSAKKREVLNEVILKGAIATGLGWVSAVELDEVGISEALRIATSRAVKSVQGLHAPFSQIVIDGKVNFLKGTALEKFVSTMPKADNLVKEVSAASIIAKVARDRYMTELAEKYPQYGFEQHVGYGTAKHMTAINEFGICPEHRKSFEPIRSMVGFSRAGSRVEPKKNTSLVGSMGEDAVAQYLTEHKHIIIARNYRTPFYEIDIVSVRERQIYFTEVKYRKDDLRGGGLAAVDKRKLKQMEYAVECFMKYYAKKYGGMEPLLAVADVAGDDYIVKEWLEIN
ncbi:ribonuclease HII [Candidatus Saccharibacteria bacterium]|nr:ribonuclease HII [Candidatus Saccharibacteria bacterium]